MNVEQAVRARILALSAVTAIVGSRVWIQNLPQSPIYPAVRVSLIDDQTIYQLRGPHGATPARVQVDGYTNARQVTDPYAQGIALMAAIDGDGLGRQATGVSGFIGAIGSPPFEIQGVFSQGRLAPRYDAEEIQVLTMTNDYIVWYVRS